MKMWPGRGTGSCGGWRQELFGRSPALVQGAAGHPALQQQREFGLPTSPLATVSLGFELRDEPDYRCPSHEGKQAGPCCLSLPSDA